MSDSNSSSIYLRMDDWTKIKEITNRLDLVDSQKTTLLINVASAAGSRPNDAPWADLSRIHGQHEFFTALFNLLQTIENPQADRALVEELHGFAMNARDKTYLKDLLDGAPPIVIDDILTNKHLWNACLDIVNGISNLPVFLNREIAKGNRNIQLGHISDAVTAIQLRLHRFAIEMDNKSYLDSQNSLKELYDRYNGYVELLNKGSQRTATLEEVNEYFKEELDGWIGKSFLPTMERVCSKP